MLLGGPVPLFRLLMAHRIRLGELRQYAKDVAWGATDDKARRLRNAWINQALRRVQGYCSWAWYQRIYPINLTAEITGSNASVTKGSRQVDLSGGELFTQDHVDQGWTLTFGQDANIPYRLVAQDGDSGTLEAEYIGDTATGLDYTLYRWRYPVPADTNKIQQIENPRTNQILQPVLPYKLDRLRHGNPSFRDSFPVAYCVRENEIQIWPGSGGELTRLLVSYEAAVPQFVQADPDDMVVDWQPEYRDLLERAIEVEVGRWLGGDAQIDYQTALGEFNAAAARYQSLETTREQRELSLNPNLPSETSALDFYYRNPRDFTDPS